MKTDLRLSDDFVSGVPEHSLRRRIECQDDPLEIGGDDGITGMGDECMLPHGRGMEIGLSLLFRRDVVGKHHVQTEPCACKRRGARQHGHPVTIAASHGEFYRFEDTTGTLRVLQAEFPFGCHPCTVRRIGIGQRPPVRQRRDVGAFIPEGADERRVHESDTLLVIIQYGRDV